MIGSTHSFSKNAGIFGDTTLAGYLVVYEESHFSEARVFNTHIGVRASNYNHLGVAECATMPKHWSLA